MRQVPRVAPGATREAVRSAAATRFRIVIQGDATGVVDAGTRATPRFGATPRETRNRDFHSVVDMISRHPLMDMGHDPLKPS
ncbi:hypothetical protein GCM10010121_000350 [Streptomyces brasiliensis]|uniref:Uncharacterized protein n=1 Tax=Streptomyces brasiliensis TaxID=1954 RepID=A0A917JZH8_9ACTN|nr:hypothetical protein GCM10010121_000350 [Streptomyces brasiliensis]